MYLFGSVARGQANATSDVDLGLIYADPPQGTLLDQPFWLEAELAALLGRSVQCVVMNTAPVDLLHRILADGVLLLDLHPSSIVSHSLRGPSQKCLPRPETFSRSLSPAGARPVTDPELLEKKLAFVESCVSELRRLALLDRIEVDIKERRFVEHTLQLAVQACLDAASHVVSDERLGEPQTHQDLFRLLERAGRISRELSERMRAAAGFRNILVHGYAEVDVRVTRDVLENHLDDLLAFTAALRPRRQRSSRAKFSLRSNTSEVSGQQAQEHARPRGERRAVVL